MTSRYMTRECLPPRRSCWRQKVTIIDDASGVRHVFYVDFGEYDDGRLAEVFINAKRTGTFVSGALDTLARTASLALQSGTAPAEVAKALRGMDYPPRGQVIADGSTITHASSIADYIGQEIAASYGPDGRPVAAPAAPEPEPAPEVAIEPEPSTNPSLPTKVFDLRIVGSGV